MCCIMFSGFIVPQLGLLAGADKVGRLRFICSVTWLIWLLHLDQHACIIPESLTPQSNAFIKTVVRCVCTSKDFYCKTSGFSHQDSAGHLHQSTLPIKLALDDFKQSAESMIPAPFLVGTHQTRELVMPHLI